MLLPLLKLHPHPVHLRTHLQRNGGEGSYTIEVSYSASAGQQEEVEECSVESAALQCLQVLKRKSHLSVFVISACVYVCQTYIHRHILLFICLYNILICFTQ